MDSCFNRQKQKLLILEQILNEETDCDHALTVNDIILKLEAYGISSSRKTVYDDIKTLNASGMKIVAGKKSSSNAYYVSEKLFHQEELHILAGAVASSKFLTKKTSDELIKKLQKLTSKFQRASLRGNVHIASRVKTTNESIYPTIAEITRAISQNKKITFKYYKFNLKKEKQAQNSGELYTASPYHLIWSNDNYYLICFCEKRKIITTYRLDRMADVNNIKEKRHQLSEEESEQATLFLSAFDMYIGKQEIVMLEVDKKLVDIILDRFGNKIIIRDSSPDNFTVRLDVQISPTFWGWLFQFGNRARIVSPPELVEQAKTELRKILDCYEQK